MQSYLKIASDLQQSIKLYLNKSATKSIEIVFRKLLKVLNTYGAKLDITAINQLSVDDLAALLKNYRVQNDNNFRSAANELSRELLKHSQTRPAGPSPAAKAKSTAARKPVRRVPKHSQIRSTSPSPAASPAGKARPVVATKNARYKKTTGRAATLSRRDDLTRLQGIGPKIQKQLSQIGLTTYEQIANLSPEDADRIGDQLSFKGRIERDRWIEQAKALSPTIPAISNLPRTRIFLPSSGQVLNPAAPDRVLPIETPHETRLKNVGSLIYNPPETMKVAQSEIIEARIAREVKPELLEGLRGRGSPQVDVIPVTAAMWLELHGDTEVFRIEGGREKRLQFIDNELTGYAQWDWLVTPLKRGEHTLTLRFAGYEIRSDGSKADLGFAPIDKDIKITVNPRHSLNYYGKWVVAAIAGAMLALFGQNAAKAIWGSAFQNPPETTESEKANPTIDPSKPAPAADNSEVQRKAKDQPDQ